MGVEAQPLIRSADEEACGTPANGCCRWSPGWDRLDTQAAFRQLRCGSSSALRPRPGWAVDQQG